MTIPKSSKGQQHVSRASQARAAGERCDHGLRVWTCEGEQLCALEYLNRFVAPQRIEGIRRSGSRLYLVFDTGEQIECCCESCGQSHGDDPGFRRDIQELAVGRRALRFRLDGESGMVVWFARGDHLHLHRNTLLRFRPRARRARSLRPTHSPEPTSTAEHP